MQSKNLNDKLIRVERTINIYNNDDNTPVKEINADVIPFNTLKKIVIPKEDDPLLYDGYVLDANQLKAINNFLKNKIAPNFVLYFYVLECTGIYDWGKNKLRTFLLGNKSCKIILHFFIGDSHVNHFKDGLLFFFTERIYHRIFFH
jgi:hypothetical protein